MPKIRGLIDGASSTPPAVDLTELAQRMREKRAAHGFTVRGAAKEAGVSASTYSCVAQGNYAPDIECVLLLAHWVGAARVRRRDHGHSWPHQNLVAAPIIPYVAITTFPHRY